ncbi:hypothetical protein EVAR_76709_1 [Eumeta japonica]|uniref:Uncharacterized protein n=1 Tax=Eumeta variegata TaxID=151549 RepID=A0A4C1SVL0_EUMVA|nr:hypothetical protein EVAR_76709_1 [Eumeta japonica]
MRNLVTLAQESLPRSKVTELLIGPRGGGLCLCFDYNAAAPTQCCSAIKTAAHGQCRRLVFVAHVPTADTISLRYT